MVRNKVILVLFSLFAIIFLVVFRQYCLLQNAVNDIEEAAIVKEAGAPTLGCTYSQYIKKSNFVLANAQQRKFIEGHAFVVNDADVNQVARLMELNLSDIPTSNGNYDSLKDDHNSLRIDTLSQVVVANETVSGYINFGENKLLYFPVAFDKKWRVMVDVTELKPIEVNNGMTGIFVEKGRHHIELLYKAPFILPILYICIICLIILTFIGLGTMYANKSSNNFVILGMSAAKLKRYAPILCFFAIFIIVYFFFHNWETKTAYGDDLFNFRSHATAKTFAEQANFANRYGKYRPINGVIFNKIIDLFQKNLHDYFLFNVGILTVNIFQLLLTLNLILESYFFSFLFSLAFGLSRFFYSSICQLTMGGTLEGLALAFFMGSLFFIVRALKKNEPPPKKQKDILLSILFANLSMYTHERYVVIFAFLLVVILLFPSLRDLSFKQKITLCIAAIASPMLNVLIKHIYSMPFFVGTGGTNIEFSFPQAMSFLKDGVLSIFQINSGPNYLIGIPFASLPIFEKSLAIVIVLSFFVGLGLFLYHTSTSLFRYNTSRIVSNSPLKAEPGNPQYLFFFLFGYFFLCLAPAIVTIRMEQRWLTASFSIFILMLVILLASIKYKSDLIKYATYSIIAISFMWINFTYMELGVNNIFMRNSERIATSFKSAMDKNIIRPGTTKLYLWEKKKDGNLENDITWTLSEGYIFKFYGAAEKQLIFVDSIYTKTDSSYTTSFPGFDARTSQIVQIIPDLRDITSEYLKDSLKTFVTSE